MTSLLFLSILLIFLSAKINPAEAGKLKCLDFKACFTSSHNVELQEHKKDVNKTIGPLNKLRLKFGRKYKAKAAVRLSDFHIQEELIGKRLSGCVVKKVQRKSDNEEFAMKFFAIDALANERTSNMVFQEIGFLIDVGVFPFTVEMIGFDYNEDGVYIFMTLITGGNLKEYCENQSNLENKNKQGMENLNRSAPSSSSLTHEKRTQILIAELVSVVKYLHSIGIAHNDFWAYNVLIDENGHLKVIDFGRSYKLWEDKSRKKTALHDLKRVKDWHSVSSIAELLLFRCSPEHIDKNQHPAANDFLNFLKSPACTEESVIEHEYLKNMNWALLSKIQTMSLCKSIITIQNKLQRVSCFNYIFAFFRHYL